MVLSLRVRIRPVRSSASGASASVWSACPALRRKLGASARPAFLSSVLVQVNALACQLPSRFGLPLSLFLSAEIRRGVSAVGVMAEIRGATLWCLLSSGALRPCRLRICILPHDPAFIEKTGRILDLYEGLWEGAALVASDSVLCADKKTSIQAHRRWHASLPPIAHRLQYFEHEHQRKGVWAHLVAQVMSQEPYRSARRVFWIIDNDSGHCGQEAIDRLCAQWATPVPVHTPVHTSWLNQVENFFSIAQRKVLTPNGFTSLGELKDRLLRLQDCCQQIAAPFQWMLKRHDLTALMDEIETRDFSVAA